MVQIFHNAYRHAQVIVQDNFHLIKVECLFILTELKDI